MAQEEAIERSTLYMVATPIGNLEDISGRALAVLNGVDFILCEDTRHSSILLEHYRIRGKLVSYFAHNEALRTDQFIPQLVAGQSAALVTDAGSPGVSDPGARIAAACHEAGVRVCPVPGCSAVVAAVSAAGFYEFPEFRFIAFFPRKQGDRRAVFERQKSEASVLVGYESPQRVVSLLEDAADVLGEHWQVCLCREMTKKFEEVTRSTVGGLLGRFREDGCRGELCLVFSGGTSSERAPSEMTGDAEKLVRVLREQGVSTRDIRDIVSKYCGVKAKTVYSYLLGADAGAGRE